jgi:hypothetical protein
MVGIIGLVSLIGVMRSRMDKNVRELIIKVLQRMIKRPHDMECKRLNKANKVITPIRVTRITLF